MTQLATEPALIDRARGGDTTAFEELLRPLVTAGCQLAYSMFRD